MPTFGARASGQRLLLVAHRGVGVGLVAAGQVGAADALVLRPGDAVAVAAARRARAVADAVGDGGEMRESRGMGHSLEGRWPR